MYQVLTSGHEDWYNDIQYDAYENHNSQEHNNLLFTRLFYNSGGEGVSSLKDCHQREPVCGRLIVLLFLIVILI